MFTRKNIILLTGGLVAPFTTWAQTDAAQSSLKEPLAIMMLSVIVILIAVIAVLGKVVLTSYEIYREKEKSNSGKITTAIITGFLLLSGSAFAQETKEIVEVKSNLIGNLSPTAFYLLLSTIVLEVIIILFLVQTFRLFAGLKKAGKPKVAKVKKKKFAWFEKLNNTKSVDDQSEAAINLGHDYDGIGELDNPTPPWWQWGFVITVIFSVVYMWTHHVSKSAPTQFEELAMANVKAEELQKAYLANSANKIDENTVTLLTENSDLLEGKTTFTAQCAACHGVDGGGIVGPNLTDEYWLHGGDIKDIFRTIKYGVPEKGMKSWKDDFSPKKIAQIASYIHSLKGTKPASPKAPEGELVKE